MLTGSSRAIIISTYRRTLAASCSSGGAAVPLARAGTKEAKLIPRSLRKSDPGAVKRRAVPPGAALDCCG